MVDFIIRDDLNGSLIFRKRLAESFPAVAGEITDFERGSLHLEVAVLARATRTAIEQGAMDDVRAHIAFMDSLFRNAAPDLENAIYVSYLENVFLGETSDRYLAARVQLSEPLKTALVELEAHWENLFSKNGPARTGPS